MKNRNYIIKRTTKKDEKEFQQLVKDFIVESNSPSLAHQIIQILINHGVKTNFKGDTFLLGDFSRLSKKKKADIEFIARKAWELFQLKKNKFVYEDLIILRKYEDKLNPQNNKEKK